MLAMDVVVRTLADASRSELLFRALDSIQSQKGISARPIVVVNGEHHNQDTLRALEQRSGILLRFVAQASAGRARAAGHRLATAEFLSFLDDDDIFMENALLKPLTWLADHPRCDVVVTNGYFVREGGKLVESSHLADHVANPALSLLDENWLSPGASIFRTRSIPPDVLDADCDHQEWTRMAFELCARGKQAHFMDVPTVLYHDTPGSLSKQPKHRRASLDLLEFVRKDARLAPGVRKKAERKYRNTLHMLAMQSWEEGEAARAWRYHLASLCPPGTLKYLLFSRRLLWPGGAGKKKAIKQA